MMGEIYIRGLGTVKIAGDKPTPEELAAITRGLPVQSEPERPIDPTEGMSGVDKALAGAGKYFSDMALGAKQVATEVPYLAGLTRDREPMEKLWREAADRKRLDAPLMNTGEGMAGYFGAGLMSSYPLGAIGANTAPGALATGMGYGMLSPTSSAQDRAYNTALGATLSLGGKFVGDKISAKINTRIKDKATAKIQNKVRDKTLQDAKDAGYVAPPAQVNPTVANEALEGISGKIKTEQLASVKNQAVTNSLAKKAIGLADDAPLTPEALRSIRNEAGKAYAAIPAAIKSITPDKIFYSNISKATSAYNKVAKQFPSLASKEVDNLMESIKTDSFDSETLVEAIKVFRRDSAANMAAFDKPMQVKLGRVQRALADEFESLIERNLKNNGLTGLVPEYKNSRQLIAKTYTIENALNESTGDVSAAKILRQRVKGVPLSGELRTIARMHQFFPKATQEFNRSVGGLSPLDYSVAALGYASTGDPLSAAGLVARPAIRSSILSKPYQQLMTTPNYGPGLISPNMSSFLQSFGGQSLSRSLGPMGLLTSQQTGEQ